MRIARRDGIQVAANAIVTNNSESIERGRFPSPADDVVLERDGACFRVDPVLL